MDASKKMKKGARGRKGVGPKKKPASLSIRAGLQFSIDRIGRFVKKGRYSHQIGSGAPVYLTAVNQEIEWHNDMDMSKKMKKGAGGQKGGGPKNKSASPSVQASLQFLVSRISRFLKKYCYSHRIGSGASVYLAAANQVIEWYNDMDASMKMKKGAGGWKGGGPKKKFVSLSIQAGLQFPVNRNCIFLKKGH